MIMNGDTVEQHQRWMENCAMDCCTVDAMDGTRVGSKAMQWIVCSFVNYLCYLGCVYAYAGCELTTTDHISLQ